MWTENTAPVVNPVDQTAPVCHWNVPAGVTPTQANDPCYMMVTEPSCSALPECTFSPPTKPLFTEDFCHPVETKKGVTAADLTMCIGKDQAACAAPCVFSNGADLIPTESFCAPRDMTKDVALIERCTNADKATCVEPDCRWRKGKTVA